MITKKAQVWIETVTYILIAFALIGLILAFARPKIQEYQDKSILEQSSKMMKVLDETIREVGNEAVGNKRNIDLRVRKGTLEINPQNNTLTFIMDSKYIYSELGKTISEENLFVTTTAKGKFNEVKMYLNYTGEYDLLQNNLTETKILTTSSTDYDLYISNKGGSPIQIDIEID